MNISIDLQSSDVLVFEVILIIAKVSLRRLFIFIMQKAVSKSLSIITVVKDDMARFLFTASSIRDFASRVDFEWIIVDSSCVPLVSIFSFKVFLEGISFIYFHERANGIYSAMNTGLSLATASHVWFLNCGDLVHPYFNRSFNSNLLCKKVIIFQPADKLGPFLFMSRLDIIKLSGAYPHQSILYAKNLHNSFGFYSKNIDADQIFFRSMPRAYFHYLNGLISCRCLSPKDATYQDWCKSMKFPSLFCELFHPLYVILRAFKAGQRIRVYNKKSFLEIFHPTLSRYQ